MDDHVDLLDRHWFMGAMGAWVRSAIFVVGWGVGRDKGVIYGRLTRMG